MMHDLLSIHPEKGWYENTWTMPPLVHPPQNTPLIATARMQQKEPWAGLDKRLVPFRNVSHVSVLVEHMSHVDVDANEAAFQRSLPIVVLHMTTPYALSRGRSLSRLFVQRGLSVSPPQARGRSQCNFSRPTLGKNPKCS